MIVIKLNTIKQANTGSLEHDDIPSTFKLYNLYIHLHIYIYIYTLNVNQEREREINKFVLSFQSFRTLSCLFINLFKYIYISDLHQNFK